jgi:glycosyltransferase involved in cell wall biosynthesis
MRTLIVVPRQSRVSGNWVTARRFQEGLEEHGHTAMIRDTPLQTEPSFKKCIIDFAPDVVILLHAYRTGKPWLEEAAGRHIPSIVLLTGTDINQGLENPEQREVIRKTLQQARFTLLQNPLIAKSFAVNHPDLSINLRLLTPGITLGNHPYELRKIHALPEDRPLFLCPAGVRPVKGVLELLEMFDQVAQKSAAFHLAFCGPVLDEGYGRRFLEAIAKRPWASYLGVLPLEVMASAMRGADVILNNSRAEGLANALLEAATIGIPILARDIPGNAAVVKENINGLLYQDENFARRVQQLLERNKRQQLICPDSERYSPFREAKELSDLLMEAFRGADKVVC